MLPDKQLNEIGNEDELLQSVLHLLSVAEEHAKPRIDAAMRAHAYYNGEGQWGRRPHGYSYRMATGAGKYRMNKDVIESGISALHPQLVRGVPGLKIEAVREDDVPYFGRDIDPPPEMYGGYLEEDVAKVCSSIVNELWFRRKEQNKQSDVVLQSLIEGVGLRVMKRTYDPLFGTLVRPVMIRRDQWLPDPSGTDLDDFEDFKWQFLMDEMTAADIESAWGIKEKEYAGEGPEKGIRDERDMGHVRRSYSMDSNGELKTNYEVPTYPVHILYWCIDSPAITDMRPKIEDQEIQRLVEQSMLDPVEYKNANMKMLVLVNRLKFANLKKNSTTLPPSVWANQMYPLSCTVHHRKLHEGQGYSLASKMIGPQDFINLMYNQIGTNVIMGNNLWWLAEEGAIKQSSAVRMGQPNAVVTVNPGTLTRNRMQSVEPREIGAQTVRLMQEEIQYAHGTIGDSPDVSGQNNTAVRSGRHAHVVLEAAHPVFAEYIRNCEAGHERTAFLEVSSLLQFADFTSPAIQYRFRLEQLPMIDLALRHLLFKISLESKSNLPTTTIGGENAYWFNLADRGLVTPKHVVKNLGIEQLLDKEWLAQLEKYSKEMIPGIPFQEQMMLKLQQMAQARQAIDGATGAGGEEMPEGGRPLPGPAGGMESSPDVADNTGIRRPE